MNEGELLTPCLVGKASERLRAARFALEVARGDYVDPNADIEREKAFWDELAEVIHDRAREYDNNA